MGEADGKLSAANAMRALHIIPGLDHSDGGPQYSVPRLCRALAETGMDVTLLSGTRESRSELSSRDDGFADIRFPAYGGWIPALSKLRLSTGLRHRIAVQAAGTDIVHNHGLWLAPNLQAGWAAAHHKKPLIVSPRGMLNPVALGFSSFKKKLFWYAAQGSVVRKAACLHVTSDQEYEEVRAFGLEGPVAIIPNGIDLPEDVSRTPQQKERRIILFLGRVHPKKGLVELLQAWRKIEHERLNWLLRIVGPAELGHDQELQKLAGSLGLQRVLFDGALYGRDKQEAFAEADLFVLPSLNENFGIAVAEALAAGVPVISTKGTPWAGLEAERCGWWIDRNVPSIIAALRIATSLSAADRSAMGARGREWMARDYSWDAIAARMHQLYRWILARGDRPPSVRLN